MATLTGIYNSILFLIQNVVLFLGFFALQTKEQLEYTGLLMRIRKEQAFFILFGIYALIMSMSIYEKYRNRRAERINTEPQNEILKQQLNDKDNKDIV